MTAPFRVLAAASTVAALAGLSACASTEAPSVGGLRPTLAGAPTEVMAPGPGGTSAYGLYLAGEAAIDGGSSRDAAAYFGKAVELDPGEDTIRNRAFSSALVAGDVPRAARAAEGLGEGDQPVQALGRLTRAVEALADDRGSQALSLLNEGGGGVHDPAFALVKPWAAAAAGDQALALSSPPGLDNAVNQGVADLGRAELLERAGRLSEAEAIYKARAKGKNGLFILGYGGFLERRGRKAEATALYGRAIADAPDDIGLRTAKVRLAAGRPPAPLPTYRQGAAEAMIAPAAMLLARREGDSGLAYLRLALRLDPSLDEAWVLVGDAMNGAGDAEAARDAYRKVTAKSDQYVAARSRLALLAQQAGDREGALRLARETLDADPQDSRALVLYADLLRDDGRFPEAVQVLNRAIATGGGSEPGWSLYYVRGVAEERAGDWPAAERDLQQALKLKPDEPQVLNYLGYAWADRGEHLKEALAMLEKAAALEPRSGAIVDSLGWARYRVRQYPDAARDLERAVLLAPADPEVNNHLGDAYWRTGRRLEARFQWQRVLTLDADAKTKAAVQAKLAGGLGPDAPARP